MSKVRTDLTARRRKKAIELIAQGAIPKKDIAKQCSVTPNTLARWQQEPSFREQVIERTYELVYQDLPEIYTALIAKCKTGSAPHIKILLDHLEKVREMDKNSMVGNITFSWDIQS